NSADIVYLQARKRITTQTVLLLFTLMLRVSLSCVVVLRSFMSPSHYLRRALRSLEMFATQTLECRYQVLRSDFRAETILAGGYRLRATWVMLNFECLYPQIT